MDFNLTELMDFLPNVKHYKYNHNSKNMELVWGWFFTYLRAFFREKLPKNHPTLPYEFFSWTRPFLGILKPYFQSFRFDSQFPDAIGCIYPRRTCNWVKLHKVARVKDTPVLKVVK